MNSGNGALGQRRSQFVCVRKFSHNVSVFTIVLAWPRSFLHAFSGEKRVIARVAGGIVGTRNNVLSAEPLKASGEAARSMGRRTLKYRLHENHWFLNSPHTSVREKRIGREKYTRQSNVR